MIDPRAENCRGFATSNGLVTGVLLQVDAHPATPYELLKVELIDEGAAGGTTVATCVVLDRNGVQMGERVYLAWPWPNLTEHALPGNPNGQHWIGNGYAPPNLGPLALYVGDTEGKPISDVVGGLGLPHDRHVSYRATWQERGSAPTTDSGTDGGDLVIDVTALVEPLERIADALERLAAHLGA